MQSFSIERVVTLLAPVFAALASWLTAFVTTHVPGAPHLDSGAVATVASAAFIGTALLVAKWLHGRQIPSIAGLSLSPQQLKQFYEEIDHYLRGHADQYKTAEHEIADVIDSYLASHAPAAFKPDIDALVNAVLARITQGLATAPPAAGAAQVGAVPQA